MSSTPPDRPGGSNDTQLNPALHQTRGDYGEQHQGTDFSEKVSVKDAEEGSSWPMIWAVVLIVCVAVTIYLAI